MYIPGTSGLSYSVLDLSPVIEGGTAAQALRNTLDLARHCEQWGYRRYWIAEHHNIPGVASAATAVVIGLVAGGTSRIRVGSGGIMLPNHSPLVIAEQFGTLESLYPGRIDLGLGRAPGGDHLTSRALRRSFTAADTFPADVVELQGYFAAKGEGLVRAIPGQGLQVPMYLLGSSMFGAELAAELGLPFAFASHFAPDYLSAALDVYRSRFRPSESHPEPYAMIGVNVFAAYTDAEAGRLFTTLQQQFLNMQRGRPRQLPPPVDRMDWTPEEEARVRHMTRCSAVGSLPTICRKLEALAVETGADEIIATAQIYDHQARLRSFEIAAEAFRKINEPAESLIPK